MKVKVTMQVIVKDETFDEGDVEVYIQDTVDEKDEFIVMDIRVEEIHDEKDSGKELFKCAQCGRDFPSSPEDYDDDWICPTCTREAVTEDEQIAGTGTSCFSS